VTTATYFGKLVIFLQMSLRKPLVAVNLA
jgi:hypothetical protein